MPTASSSAAAAAEIAAAAAAAPSSAPTSDGQCHGPRQRDQSCQAEPHEPSVPWSHRLDRHPSPPRRMIPFAAAIQKQNTALPRVTPRTARTQKCSRTFPRARSHGNGGGQRDVIGWQCRHMSGEDGVGTQETSRNGRTYTAETKRRQRTGNTHIQRHI